MEGTVVGYVLIVGGIVALSFTIVGRIRGSHQPSRWESGGRVSLLGELGFGFLMISGGVFFLRPSPLAFVSSFSLMILLFIDQGVAGYREKARKRLARRVGAARYPEVFQEEPPEDIENQLDEYTSVYDFDESIYLGNIRTSDLNKIIDRFSSLSDTGKNDLFLLEEAINDPDQVPLSKETLDVLNRGMAGTGAITLRWSKYFREPEESDRLNSL